MLRPSIKFFSLFCCYINILHASLMGSLVVFPGNNCLTIWNKSKMRIFCLNLVSCKFDISLNLKLPERVFSFHKTLCKLLVSSGQKNLAFWIKVDTNTNCFFFGITILPGIFPSRNMTLCMQIYAPRSIHQDIGVLIEQTIDMKK